MPATNPLLHVPLSDTNETLLHSYDRALRARNASPRTRQSYREAAVMFAAFLDGADLESATKPDVERFMAFLLERHSSTTAAVRFRALRAMYSWAVVEDLIVSSPVAGMRAPTVRQEPVDVLSDDDLRALLSTCSGRSYEDRRDTALIRLFIDTGGRLSEIVRLRLDDVDMRQDQVTFLGKGNKVRVVPMGTRTAQAVERFLRARKLHPAASIPEVFIGGRGGPLTPSGVAQMLRRRAEQAGLGKVHPHMFRHTAAHYAASHGMGDDSLMRLMGWTSREMLNRYGASAGEERARGAHRSLAPGDRV